MNNFFTLFLLTLGLSFNAHAFSTKECVIKELKVQAKTDFSNVDHKGYLVGNLEQSFWLTDRDPQVRAHLERSYQNKNQSFELTFPQFVCDMIKSAQGGVGRPLVGNPDSIRNSRLTTTTDCIDCVNLSNAPVAFEFSSMKEINDILSHAIGLRPEQVRKFKHELYATLKTMDYKTPQANSIALLMMTFEALFEFGVDKIDSTQLEYLTTLLQGDITEEERGFFKELSAQVDVIQLETDRKGQKVVKILSATGRPIMIQASSIPARSAQERAFMEEHLDYISLDHEASFTFIPKQNHRPQKVEVKGLEIKGLVPVVGKIGVRPQHFIIDLEAAAPVEARVQFRKGIRISKTFSIDY